MIVLVARYQAKPGMGDRVLAALREMHALVQAHEPGCAMYQVCRSADDPDAFLLYEQYHDQAALQAHRDAPHFKQIVEHTIVPMLESRERAFYSLELS